MRTNRGEFLKLAVTGGLGICCINPFLASNSYINIGLLAEDLKKSNFPFFKYIEKYQIGEIIPKDQGGKLVHMELLGTENDKEITDLVKNGIIEKEFGVNIGWDIYEDTQVEKSVWLNRFYFLPSFARMYFLTKEVSYTETMMHYISMWIRENPLSEDGLKKNYNWRDMQAAWRAIHWTWCLFLTEEQLKKEDKEVIEKSLQEHGEVLVNWFGRQELNEFNHQVHGGLAMLYLGVFFPHFKNAGELKNTGITILKHHLNNAFYTDGGNVEQMFGYYPFETHIFRDFLLIGESNNIPVPRNLKSFLIKMGDFMKTVAQPNQTMPPINDSYEMPIGPSIDILEDILETSIKGRNSALFEETQFAVFRTLGKENAWYATCNPAKTIGAHSHAGRLGFTLWYSNSPIIVESGVSNYDDPKLVSWYRTSRAHNTVLIDGQSDFETSTDVLWASKRETENKVLELEENEIFSSCSMLSPKSKKVNSGVSWTRTLAIVKSKFVILHDCFNTDLEHDYELLLHFPDGEFSNQGKNLLWKSGSNAFKILTPNPDLYQSVAIENGLINKNATHIAAPIVSYKFKEKGVTHSILVIAPNQIELDMELESNKDGIGVKFSENMEEEVFLLVKNPDAKQLSAFGQISKKEFNVL
ncbi:alginate lyase family protein [Salegentibacter sediminis]|uniref:alginate lyase family protein n=1 Tax=Salegentibacter sediminis TaxID=1930251 RepID=UPI0009C11F5A|nr:alginate lyase family protein [Salegentibacter sediminis]